MSRKHGQTKKKAKTVLLIGTPNIGKSAIFNKITGLNVSVANYVGTTVDFAKGNTVIKNISFELIDVPGTYTLYATNDAEKVAVEMLSKNPDLVVCVIDANNLEVGIYLLLQVLEKSLPTIVVVNRIDLLHEKGYDIDINAFLQEFGVPVIATVAVTGEGLEKLRENIYEALNNPKKPDVKTTKGRDTRWEKAELLSKKLTIKKADTEVKSFRKKLGEMLIKPWPGLPLAILILGIAFGWIVGIGMGLRQGVLLPLVRGMIIPEIIGLVEAIFPPGVIQNILIGEYGFLIKGLEWPFTLVLPYVISFYFVMSILEDSGYLPRLGCLLDGLLHRVGLHGSSVIPILLGYGCGIPAILSTRTLGSFKERWIVTVMVCVSVPCISQTGALISLLAERSVIVMFMVFLLAFIAMITAGLVTNKLVKGSTPPVLMEIPELLFPSAKVVFKKVWMRIKRFINDGVLPMIMIIAIAALLHETGIMKIFGELLSPLVTEWLNLPEEAAVPLILGILRRELAVAPLIDMELTTLQLFVGSIVGLFYVPCVAIIAIVAREFGILASVKVLVLTMTLAFLIGGIFAKVGMIFF